MAQNKLIPKRPQFKSASYALTLPCANGWEWEGGKDTQKGKLQFPPLLRVAFQLLPP